MKYRLVRDGLGAYYIEHAEYIGGGVLWTRISETFASEEDADIALREHLARQKSNEERNRLRNEITVIKEYGNDT